MLEVKHVPLDKGVLDVLIGPRDEQLVVVVGLGWVGVSERSERSAAGSTFSVRPAEKYIGYCKFILSLWVGALFIAHYVLFIAHQ